MPALQSATGDARLMLGRFRMTTRVPRDRAATGEASANAKTFFADHLAPALKEVLAPMLDSGDPSVWVIRRLNVQILSDRASGHREIGRTFARSFQQAMVRAFQDEGSLNAIRFPDRASYLAQFLVDLADGGAWDRWYYRHFSDLRPLPFGSAVRMLIEREQPNAPAALIKVEERGRLPRLIDQLGENDAHRIYSVLVPPAKASAAAQDPVIALADILTRQPSLLAHGTGFRTQLALLVTAAARLPLSLGAVAAAVETVLAALAAAHGSAEVSRDAIADVPGGPSSAPRQRRGLAEQVAVMAERLRSEGSQTAPRRRNVHDEASSLTTPFAGVFLLWRSALELGLGRLVVRGLDAPRASVRAFVLAAKLAGPAWRAALDDESVQWLAGVAEPPHDDDVAAALIFAADERAAVARGILARLLDLRGPTPLNLLLQADGDVVILQDADRQDWLAAARGPPETDLGDAEIGWLLLPDAVGLDRVPEAYRAWYRVAPQEPGFTLLVPEPTRRDEASMARVRQTIGALRPVDVDLSYFVTHGDVNDPPSALLWAVLARAAYSDLARRLPGLALSSAHYLGRNVVQGQGSFARSFGEHDAEVVLPPVPMDLVLRMTGLDRTVLRLGDGRSVLIRLPGG